MKYKVIQIIYDVFSNNSRLEEFLNYQGNDDWEHYHTDYVGDGARFYFKKRMQSI